jgi:predicted small lipoprotein YifL
MRLTMPTLGRGLLLSSAALLVATSLSACGRRGPLEPPEAAAASPAAAQPGAPADPRLRRSRTSAGQPRATTLSTNTGAVVEDTPDDDTDDAEQMQSVVPSPTPTARKRGRNFLVPNDPFVLDALL